jgi:predicted aspartyl protease
MGSFTVGCRVENVAEQKKWAAVPRILVDTGSEFTWIGRKVLEQIGVAPRKKDVQIQMANGQIVTRSVGYAVLRVASSETVDEVVFAERGDLLLLGSRALEGLNLRVDARHKRLVAAGPVVAATAVRPSFGAKVRVPVRKATGFRGVGRVSRPPVLKRRTRK